MQALTGSSSIDRFFQAAKDAGLPKEQVANFARFNIAPTRKQLEFHAAARLADRPCNHPAEETCNPECAPSRIACGGARGGGKSHSLIAQVVCDDMQRFPGIKFLYLRKVSKAAKEAVKDLCRDVLHSTPHSLKVSGLLTTPNGSSMVLGHYHNENDIDGLLGIAYDGAIIEEATQLSHQKELDIGASIRSSRPGWRPRRYYGCNPGGVGHGYFKRDFITPYRNRDQITTRFFPSTVRDNPFVDPGYVRNLMSLTGWKRKAWLDGDWDVLAGQYFKNWSHNKHVINRGSDANWRPGQVIPANWPVWIALDYGFVHYTACYLFTKDFDGNVYVVGEYVAQGRLIPTNAKGIKSMLARYGVTTQRLMKMVAGNDLFAKTHTGGSKSDEYIKEGFYFASANDARIEGAGVVLKRFGDEEFGVPPTVFISDECPKLIETIPNLEHDPNNPEDVLKIDMDSEGNGGDDAYDAFRYGLMEAELGQAVYVAGDPQFAAIRR